jgi:RND family efflux transporter MFP subunit
MSIRLRLIDEKDFSHVGRMDFVDNVIDRTSGTIRGRAQFANADGLFIPGMFARAEVPSSAPYEALLVPDAAIGTEQVRKFVYVVGADNVARQVYIQPGQVADDLRVIKDGLSADDRVVVNGMMRVRPGVKVNAEEEGAAPASKGPQARTN